MIEREAMTLLAAALKELGVDEGPIRAIGLTREGYVIGHRFECGPIRAMWFFDENEVKIFDQDGQLLKILELTTNMGKAA
jgi:hypothetical protein